MSTWSHSVEELVRRIVDAVHPLRVILFGSSARGDATSTSDVDLLVIMPNGTHRRRTAQELYRKVRGMGVPVDFVVATPSDLAQHRDNAGLIYRTILEEGKEIYAL